MTPIYDSLEFISAQSFANEDFAQGKKFLESYKGNPATFNSYRREIEKLLQWATLIAKKPLTHLKREDIVQYIDFCCIPPLAWIGDFKAVRFSTINRQRIPNPNWSPFVVTVSKSAYQNGQLPDKKNYALSKTCIQQIFAILGSFYNFLIQENYCITNPVLLIRQKSKYLPKRQGKAKIRRLSPLQWDYVLKSAADDERALFILSALYSMYLRISELAKNNYRIPRMNDFFKDNDGNWWFNVIGKGNKERQITVSDSMLSAVKRYRVSLNLPPLPALSDDRPLLNIESTYQIRKIVQRVFNQAAARLESEGLLQDKENVLNATVHWLRHTGISDDIKHRPREHVRDDAGHNSSLTTDKYIDVELVERHNSARHKQIYSSIGA